MSTDRRSHGSCLDLQLDGKRIKRQPSRRIEQRMHSSFLNHSDGKSQVPGMYYIDIRPSQIVKSLNFGTLHNSLHSSRRRYYRQLCTGSYNQEQWLIKPCENIIQQEIKKWGVILPFFSFVMIPVRGVASSWSVFSHLPTWHISCTLSCFIFAQLMRAFSSKRAYHLI